MSLSNEVLATTFSPVSDLGAGIVFGLGYYLINHLYGDSFESDLKKDLNQKANSMTLDKAKTVEDFNNLIKIKEKDTFLNPFEILHKMNNLHLNPGIMTYNNLLNYCFINEKFEIAEKLSEEIFDFTSPVHFDTTTYNILLKGISIKISEKNEKLLEENEKRKKELSALYNLLYSKDKQMNFLQKKEDFLNNIQIYKRLRKKIFTNLINKNEKIPKEMIKYVLFIWKARSCNIVQKSKYDSEYSFHNFALNLLSQTKDYRELLIYQNHFTIFSKFLPKNVLMTNYSLSQFDFLLKNNKTKSFELPLVTFFLMSEKIKDLKIHFVLKIKKKLYEEYKFISEGKYHVNKFVNFLDFLQSYDEQ